METWKSRVDVQLYIDLLLNVLADAYASYPEISSREYDRDELTIRKRVAAEGLSFLTKTLPSLGKALLVGLEAGQLTVPPSFAHKRKCGEQWNIPELFSELFLTIFDREGYLALSSRPAVGEIHQLCMLCYKLELGITVEQAIACEQKYQDIEAELPDASKIRQQADAVDPNLIRISRYLLRKLFDGFDPSKIQPRHGPGAVADHHVRGREKYNVYFYSPQIDRLYPYVTHATFGIHAQTVESLTEHTTLTGNKPPAKVVFVPKDSRGPRIISCEPALLQYLQQGLSREICWLVEQHPLTRDCVHFTDQLPNRLAAFHSSSDKRFATIDLADASDRVSVDLVRLLFPEEIVPYLLGTRSESSQLPSGRVLTLKKFAPMGSALCFPIEALTFWAICTATLWTISHRRWRSWSRLLVFGDDIIVPRQDAHQIILALEAFGLKVNKNKCFIDGNFRESCGCDAFLGEDVTPVKIRVHHELGRGRSRVDAYRLSKSAQHLFDKGYWRAADFLWKWCEKQVGSIPTAAPNFQGICRTSSLLPPVFSAPEGLRKRWNKDLQRWEIRSFWLKARETLSPFSRDVYRLGHNLIQGMPEPYDDHVAVPHSALPKAGWAAV